uniref:Deoxyribodipyrimidine photo-lyase n=1 Tax=Lygus hesperus TaxID=30085 RepID=A0A0A9ZFL0_LYGHE
MCQSLHDLDEKQLNGRLVCLRGSDEQCLKQISKSGLQLSIIGFNCDYTPFAMVRDERMEQYCIQHNIECVKSKFDYTLLPLDSVMNGSDQPYSMFTPFYNKLMSEHASKIQRVDTTPFHVDRMFFENGKKYLAKYIIDPISLMNGSTTSNTGASLVRSTEAGGRAEGLKKITGIKTMIDYKQVRDFLGRDKTSHLSPHLKFGTVSIREAWHTAVQALGSDHALVRQFVWREFYSMLIYHHPRLVQGQLNVFRATKDEKPKLNAPFQAKFDKFKWKWDSKHYELFKQGQTGVPLVDAAVRCLNATGWCHNRARLVAGSFLVKVLGVDWREGERWYATVAVDYDVANNSGGWLWVSGQGADAQPFFRMFNPYRQSQKFD